PLPGRLLTASPWLSAAPVRPCTFHSPPAIAFALPRIAGAIRPKPAGFRPTAEIFSTAVAPPATLDATLFRPPVVSPSRLIADSPARASLPTHRAVSQCRLPVPQRLHGAGFPGLTFRSRQRLSAP